MTIFKSKFQKWAVIFGLIFLLSYLFQDFLWEKFWVGSFLLAMLLAVIFIVIFIVGLFKKDKKVIPILILVVVVISATEILKTETFKSPKVLRATLLDDRSAINLTLRKNNTFEVSVATIFSDQHFTGKYKILNDKIIFLDKPYDNDFIPDTLTIFDDKIILRFDRNNKPITDFATYFEINQNRLKTVANNQKQRAFSEQGKLQYTSGSKRLRKHCNSQNNLLKFVS